MRVCQIEVVFLAIPNEKRTRQLGVFRNAIRYEEVRDLSQGNKGRSHFRGNIKKKEVGIGRLEQNMAGIPPTRGPILGIQLTDRTTLEIETIPIHLATIVM